MSMRCMVLMLMTAASMDRPTRGFLRAQRVGDAAFLLAIAALDTDAPGTSAKLLSQPHLASDVDLAFRSAPLLIVRKSQITKMKLCNSPSGSDRIYGDYAVGFTDVNDADFGKRAASLKQIVRGGRCPLPG